jgi:uncharacterized protein YkwD
VLRTLLFVAFMLLLALAVAACSTTQVAEEAPTAPPPSLAPATPTPRATSRPQASPTITPSPEQAKPPTPNTAPNEYTVQAGDTMLALATDWGVSLAAIQLENGLGASTSLQVGQVLAVPASDQWVGTSTYWVVYVVSVGDTLGEIAKRYGLDANQLLTVNDLADADLIQLGQELILPLNTLAAYAELPATAPVQEEPVPSSTPESSPTPNGAQSPGDGAPADALPPALPAGDIADWPRETVGFINQIRAEHGLPPYQYNDILAQAAQAHANDCVARGWCSHTGSDGSSVKVRIVRAGYVGSGYAECWAQQPTPQEAVEMWMDEVPPNDEHRRMMLHTWFTEVGVGVAKAPWGYYFIADFGRP